MIYNIQITTIITYNQNIKKNNTLRVVSVG